MARGRGSPLFLLTLSVASPSRSIDAFAINFAITNHVPRVDTIAKCDKASQHRSPRRRTLCKHTATTPSRRESISGRGQQDMVADEARRALVAQIVAEEVQARSHEMQLSYTAQLDQERTTKAYELAKQRVDLLKGMIPQDAHEAVVASYERTCASALREIAASNIAGLRALAGDFAGREEALRATINERDASLREAAGDLRGMADSLACLKQDVRALRAALRSHLSEIEEARKAVAREIRQTEVEPERNRADTAEAQLSDLRRDAQGWLAAAHSVKRDAVRAARATGYEEGYARGSEESEAAVAAVQMELDVARQALLEHLARSSRERIALREEVAQARQEAFEMVSAAAAAGAEALRDARPKWIEDGRDQGLAAGIAKGKAIGRLAGRTDAERALEERIQAAEKGEADARAAAAQAAGSEAKLREAFGTYVVSAHEQKLRALASAEAQAPGGVQQGLADELASTRVMLADVLQERIIETESRRDAAVSNLSIEASTTGAASPRPEFPGAAALGNAITPDKARFTTDLGAGSRFWQECGGDGSRA